MRAYNEFSAVWRAPVFQRGIYQDAGQSWKGIALRYLLLVQLICWLPTFVIATISLSNFIRQEAPAALKDFPKITIHGGHVSSPVAQPYIISDERGRPVFVLDTTGKIRTPSEVGARMLLTETTMVQEERPGVIKTNPLSGIPDMSVDSAWLISWMKLARNCLLPVGYPAIVVLSMLWRLLVALVLALFGMILIKPMGAVLSFGALMRLAILSMTSVMLLDTLVGLTSIPLGCFSWLLYPAISLGYMTYAVKVNGDLTRAGQPAFPVDFPSQPPA